MDLASRRKRGRPKRRFMDTVKEDRRHRRPSTLESKEQQWKQLKGNKKTEEIFVLPCLENLFILSRTLSITCLSEWPLAPAYLRSCASLARSTP